MKKTTNCCFNCLRIDSGHTRQTPGYKLVCFTIVNIISTTTTATTITITSCCFRKSIQNLLKHSSLSRIRKKRYFCSSSCLSIRRVIGWRGEYLKTTIGPKKLTFNIWPLANLEK